MHESWGSGAHEHEVGVMMIGSAAMCASVVAWMMIYPPVICSATTSSVSYIGSVYASEMRK